MSIILGETQKQALYDVCEALYGIREMAKEKVAKFRCHEISVDEVEEIYLLCQQIQTVLQALKLESASFKEVYRGIYSLILYKNTYDMSIFFDEKMITLLEKSINELKTYAELIEEKRTIRIKYVDFYPEFNPFEHWLYKLLIKKYNVVFSDMPDYLFFSCFGSSFLSYNCVRIFISNEAVYPNLNLYDYAVTYADFTITDRLLPNMDAFEDLQYKRMAFSAEEAYDLLQQKQEFCNFVYSNGNGDPFRKELFDALSSYKCVTAGGKFLNNVGYCVDDLQEFQSKFKFSISCENSFYKGYTTEKIINAFNAKTIPIYWGNPDVIKIINSKAIINCHEFPDIYSVIEEIKRLDNDDEAYMEKLQEPILVDEYMVEKYLAERETFIYHIIDQPYVEAFRRNQGLRGQWYNDFMCYVLGYPNEWFTQEKAYFIKEKKVLGPLVSILIPVYNRREIVKEAITSALAQTYDEIEIIVVDNCSTDGTYEELQKVYGSNPKVQLFQNDRNIGPVNNWKVCMDKANGKYVKILWSDDLITSKFVEKCVEVMESDNTIGMAYSTCWVFQGNDKSQGFLLHQLGEETGKYSKEVFYKGMFVDDISLPVSPGCAMFRREDVVIMDNIPNGLGIDCNSNGAGIDLMIYLKVLEKYENFYYFSDVMSLFRYHEGSITATNNLVREYNLAKTYFCQTSADANKYLQNMYMRILRDENITDEVVGVEMLRKYGWISEG